MNPALEAQSAPARALPGWASKLLTREPGTAQALFRAAVGLCVLISLGSVLWHGDLAPLWLDPAHGGCETPHANWLFQLLGGADPQRIRLVLGATLAAGVLLVVGLGGRFSALVALFGYDALIALNPDAGGSYDPLMTNALWLLALSDSTETLSLDCWLRTRRFRSDRRISSWPRWLALYQLVLMYFTTGIQKVSDTWVPGGGFSAVYYVMQQPTWQRIDMRWLAHLYPLTQLATALVWCFEVSAPLLLVLLALQRRGKLVGIPVRRLWASFGLTLHLGIAAFLVLGPFPWLSMAMYLALWSPEAAITAPKPEAARP